MANNVIKFSTLVKQSEDQVSTSLDGETVLMNIEHGNYYGMDEVLSRIWALIEKPTLVSDLCKQVIQEYDVKQDVCEKEVLEVLNELEKEKLVEVS